MLYCIRKCINSLNKLKTSLKVSTSYCELINEMISSRENMVTYCALPDLF